LNHSSSNISGIVILCHGLPNDEPNVMDQENYEGPFILKAELAHTQNEDEPQPIFVSFFMTGSCNSLHKKRVSF